MGEIYFAILRKIERARYDVFSPPSAWRGPAARSSRSHLVACAPRAAARTLTWCGRCGLQTRLRHEPRARCRRRRRWLRRAQRRHLAGRARRARTGARGAAVAWRSASSFTDPATGEPWTTVSTSSPAATTRRSSSCGASARWTPFACSQPRARDRRARRPPVAARLPAAAVAVAPPGGLLRWPALRVARSVARRALAWASDAAAARTRPCGNGCRRRARRRGSSSCSGSRWRLPRSTSRSTRAAASSFARVIDRILASRAASALGSP